MYKITPYWQNRFYTHADMTPRREGHGEGGNWVEKVASQARNKDTCSLAMGK